MINSFYIIQTNKGHWQLRLTESHMVMSSNSDKEEIIHCLERIVGKYKNLHTLNKAIKKMSEREKNSEETMRKRKEEYETFSVLYEEEVEAVVRKVLKDVVHESPLKKTKRKVKMIPLASENRKAAMEEKIPAREGSMKIKTVGMKKIGKLSLQ